MDRGAQRATIHGVAESDMTEHAHTSDLYHLANALEIHPDCHKL